MGRPGWNDSYNAGRCSAVVLLQSEPSTMALIQISNPGWRNSCGRTEGSMILLKIHSLSGCSDVYVAFSLSLCAFANLVWFALASKPVWTLHGGLIRVPKPSLCSDYLHVSECSASPRASLLAIGICGLITQTGLRSVGVRSSSILLEFPVTVVKRTDLAGLKPSGYAVEVESML